jgi:hypothetical protein
MSPFQHLPMSSVLSGNDGQLSAATSTLGIIYFATANSICGLFRIQYLHVCTINCRWSDLGYNAQLVMATRIQRLVLDDSTRRLLIEFSHLPRLLFVPTTSTILCTSQIRTSRSLFLACVCQASPMDIPGSFRNLYTRGLLRFSLCPVIHSMIS